MKSSTVKTSNFTIVQIPPGNSAHSQFVDACNKILFDDLVVFSTETPVENLKKELKYCENVYYRKPYSSFKGIVNLLKDMLSKQTVVAPIVFIERIDLLDHKDLPLLVDFVNETQIPFIAFSQSKEYRDLVEACKK